jgi:hypothetical protein
VFGRNGGSGGVIVPNSPTLQLQDFTIEAWVQRGSLTNASSSPGGGVIFGYGYAPSTVLLGGVIAIEGAGGYSFSMTDDGHLSLGFGSLTALGTSIGLAQITDTNWHHVAVTKSGMDVEFYSDGLPYGAPPFPNWLPFQFLTNAAVGIRADTLANGFIGSIDELTIYNRPLSATEIVAIYNATSAGKCTVGPPPAILMQPSAETVSIGNRASFGVAASGIGTVDYQWQSNGTNIAGATNSTFEIAEAKSSDTGNYSVTVSDATGSTLSSNALLVVNSISSIPPPSGLVGWWPANGSAVDAVGGNDGTLTGQSGYLSGKVGLAFSLNGNGDGVLLGNPTSLQLQDFTIDAWIKRGNAPDGTTSDGVGTIFAYTGGGVRFPFSGGPNFGLTEDGRLFLEAGDNFFSLVYADSPQIVDMFWHHVAVTKSGTTALFYLDGITYSAPAFTAGFEFTGTAAIGTRPDSLQNSFVGSIDELSIYNRALLPSEILAIYNASSNGKSQDNYLAAPQTGAQMGINFTASTLYSDSSALLPSANGAIGPAHFVELINGRFNVYDKVTGNLVQTLVDTDFWTGAGINLTNGAGVAGPRILFDASSQRWFASGIDVPAMTPSGSNHFLLAVSATSDPTGSWSGVQTIADSLNSASAVFPTMGIDAFGVYQAADLLDSAGNRVGSALTVYPKSKMLGARASTNGLHAFDRLNYTAYGNILQPAVTIGASSGGQAVLSTGDPGSGQPLTNLFCFLIGNLSPASALNATLTTPQSVTVPPYLPPLNAHQPDGTANLDVGDGRFSAQVYRLRNMLYAVHNVAVNGRSAVEWYLVNAVSGVVIQTGQLTDPNLDLFYPSMAVNGGSTVVIACNGSSTGTYVSCYAAVGQTTNGVLGFGTLQLLKAGSGLYQQVDFSSRKVRWGDYSTTTVDPVNPSHFWAIQMYPSSANTWSTQITELITDSAAGAPPLTIGMAGGMLTVSWPATSTDYLLQISTSFPDTNWATVPQTPVRTGNFYVVTMPIPSGAGFFRLINQ